MQAFARRIVFAFLADVRERFFSQFGDSAQGAVAYEYNTDFSQVLHDRGVFFSENPRADTINRVRGELAEVKNIMVENIEKVSRLCFRALLNDLCSLQRMSIRTEAEHSL